VQAHRTSESDLYARGSHAPWLHLAATIVSGLAIAIACISALRDVGFLDLAFTCALLVLGSAIEWWVHRGVMHERRDGFSILFERHAIVHHGTFRPGSMSIESPRELSIVLLKPWIVPVVAAISAPFAIFFVLLSLPNFAAISIAIPAIYVLAYECIHLVCHLPDRMAITRLWPLAALRRHHAIHHDPSRMKECNFNVAFPLWDRVRGTLAKREGDV
jgi:hypothetical protein